MRLFVGIALADEVVRELAAVATQLQDAASGQGASGSRLRWTEPESWHVTLQFLGNAAQEQYECLRAQLGEVRAAAVALTLGELGSFDRSGVFFADVVVTPELAVLQQKVADATARCGFVAETRPFHPHITLARAKDQGRASGLRKLKGAMRSQPAFSGCTAREFLLYESHLGREGARYQVRGRFALGKP